MKTSLKLLLAALAALASLALLSGGGLALASEATLEGKVAQAKGQWILKLPTRLALSVDGESATSKRIQLVGYSQVGALMLNNLDGQHVRLRGVLGLAHTRYHTEPIIFVVNDTAIRAIAAEAGRR